MSADAMDFAEVRDMEFDVESDDEEFDWGKHPWLNNVEAFTKIMRGDVQIPHQWIRCKDCEDIVQLAMEYLKNHPIVPFQPIFHCELTKQLKMLAQRGTPA